MKIGKILIGLIWGLWSLSPRAAVETAELPDLVIGGVGLETGLTTAVWGDPIDSEKLKAQLQDIQNIAFDPAEREILKRVLLTRTGEVDVLIPRLETLMAQGFFEDVLRLIDRIPPAQRTDEVRQWRIRALMAEGKTADVCTEEMIAGWPEEVFIRTVCALMSKTLDEAALAFDVYRESGADTYPFLNGVGDKIVRYQDVSLPDGQPDWIEIPLIAKAFEEDVFQLPLKIGELQMLSRSDFVPDLVQKKAAEMLQQKVELSPAEKETALELLKTKNDLRARLERLVPPVSEAADVGR